MKKSNTFKDYIRKTFITYTVAFVLLVFVLFILSVFFTFRETIVQTNLSFNSGLGRFLEDELQLYEQDLQSLVQEDPIQSSFHDRRQILKANQLLYSFSNTHKIRSYFALLDKDGTIVATNLYQNNQTILSESYHLKDVLTKLAGTPEMQSGMNRIPFDDPQKSPYFFAKAITEQGRVNGYLLFFLYDLEKYLRSSDVDIVAITDAFDNVIYASNPLLVNSMGKISLDAVTKHTAVFNGNLYYMTSQAFKSNQLHVISMTSVNNYRQLLIMGIAFLLGISIVIVLLIFFVTPKLMKRNLQSFDSLISAVNQFKEGNVEYRIESKTFDEFQTIYDEFNNMVAKIESLMKHNAEVAEKKRQMEIKHLENQFNPHFVFNVLEMLRYEILFDANNASNIVVSFANLMRYNIHYGNVEVPLKTDIKYIKDYLALQKMRYNERLDYSIQIDDTLLDCKIPKLLIQPIIENSIKHCIENTRHLSIQITARKVENTIEITVEDDGPGIEEDRLAYVRSILADKDLTPEQIGLNNSHRVIQLLYGADYGLSIYSKSGLGTKVVMRIPIIGDR
ncbi:sensor histidine kinase [Brevibacillus sp. B_LB10_24]|uniref:sensor histidine kinase n=1 Tax=Brevibacillus sp. B_LB10_24 TaxID=3380645 RepID=UPI0038BCA98D